ncbi:MAG: flippase [Candidatus Omnitrophota bacterium]
MSLLKKILHNSGAIFLCNIIDALFFLLISIVLVHYFGQSDFGKISFLGVFFFLLATLDSLWLRPILIREISKDEGSASTLLGNGFIIRALLSLGSLILFWVTICWVGISQEMIFMGLLVSFNMLLSPFIFSFEIVFRFSLNMLSWAKIKLAGNILTLMIIGFVIFFNGNLVHFLFLSIIPSLFVLLMGRHRAGTILKPSYQMNMALWKNIFIRGWFLGLSGLFIFIYHRIDQIMLFHTEGAVATGLYAASVRLVEWLQIIPVALMSSLLPFLSFLADSAEDRFKKIYCLCFKYLLMFIIPVALMGVMFSGNIIRLFYGQDFVAAGPAFAILIVAEIFVFLGIVNNTILIATNKQFLDPVFTGCTVVINFLLNLLLIPKYGFMGAAVASLVAYATGPCLGLFIPLTRPYSSSMVYYAFKPLLASFFLFIFNYFFHLTFFVAMVVLPIIYFTCLYFINFFNKDDIYLIRN